MLTRKNRNLKQLEEYARLVTGTFHSNHFTIDYRLTEPLSFALTGQANKLEALIRKGLPVLGIDPDILHLLERPLSLKDHDSTGDLFNPSATSWLWYESKSEPQGPFFTTVQLAVLGEQYETLCMLLSHGARFDLRCSLLRKIFIRCSDKQLLNFALEHPDAHCEALSYTDILCDGDLALPLVQALYEHGCYPSEDVLSQYARLNLGKYEFSLFDGINTTTLAKLKKTALYQFFLEKGYELHMKVEPPFDFEENFQDTDDIYDR